MAEALIWIFCIFIGWWVLKYALAFIVPAWITGRLLLTKKLREKGIDVNQIPREALDEIVQHLIGVAKIISEIDRESSYSKYGYGNWRANLAHQILLAADSIEITLISGGTHPDDDKFAESIAAILVRHGVIES